MRYPPWDRRDEQILADLWPTHWSADLIATHLGVSYHAVCHRANKLGLRKGRDRFLSTSVFDGIGRVHFATKLGDFEALLDESDLYWLLSSSLNPYLHAQGRTAYVYLSGLGQNARKLHRLLLDATDEQIVDHINGNGLDNRRCNLRFATAQQNAWNTGHRDTLSGFKGVWLHRRSGLWTGTIQKPCGHRQSIGYFVDPAEAARARDALALEIHGEFARLNFCKQGVA